ncbi:MAG: CARDB domain-containing protein [Armatimonadota bacterium]
MKRLPAGIPALAFLALVTALVTAAAARPSWTQPRPVRPASTTPVRYLASFVGQSHNNFEPVRMNNHGHFAGILSTQNGERVAVQKGLATDTRIALPMAGTVGGFNDAGTVVGSYAGALEPDGDALGAFAWNDANSNDTAEPSEVVGLGVNNGATDVSTAGVIVGWAGSLAARWDGQLDFFSGMDPSAADSVSENGRILFKSWDAFAGTTDYLLWTEGVSTPIGTSSDAGRLSLYEVNSSGRVVGAGPTHPVIWDAQQGMRTLDELGEGSAFEINDPGVVVGWYFNPNFGMRPFAWYDLNQNGDSDPGEMVDLNQAVVNGGNLSGVSDINDNGQILAWGRGGQLADGTPVYDYYRLDPVTEKDLSVTLTDSPDPVTVGADLTYTVTVRNHSDHTATGVLVEGGVPFGLTAKSRTTSHGSFDGADWHVGNLAAGASATATIVVTPTSSTSGLANSVTVSLDTGAGQYDSVLENNTAETRTVVNAPADPPILFSVSPSSAAQGETLEVQITAGDVQQNATVSFGEGITTDSLVVNGSPGTVSQTLVANITVAADAAPGTRSVTLSNPDGQTATLANSFTVTGGTAPGKPDLTGAWTRNPSYKYQAGSRPGKGTFYLSGTFQVSNTGAEKARKYSVVFFLSTTQGIEGALPLGKAFSFKKGLKAGGATTIKLKKVALKEKRGNPSAKYVIAVLDPAGTVDESDEADNTIAFGPLP